MAPYACQLLQQEMVAGAVVVPIQLSKPVAGARGATQVTEVLAVLETVAVVEVLLAQAVLAVALVAAVAATIASWAAAVAGLAFWAQAVAVLAAWAAPALIAPVGVGAVAPAAPADSLALLVVQLAAAAFTAVALLKALRAVMPLVVLSALFGPVQPVHSHLLTRGTSNAFVQRGLVTLSAVSGARARTMACTSGRAYDWHGNRCLGHVSICGVHGSCLRGCSRYDYRLHSHVHTGLHHRYGGIISRHG
jgi:hypothetical protein